MMTRGPAPDAPAEPAAPAADDAAGARGRCPHCGLRPEDEPAPGADAFGWCAATVSAAGRGRTRPVGDEAEPPDSLL